MKFNLIINVGDIIHQTKDNIIFTVIKKDKQHIYLEYYDKPNDKNKTVPITRKDLRQTFEINGQHLNLIRVSK
jgi:hypothetical protein